MQISSFSSSHSFSNLKYFLFLHIWNEFTDLIDLIVLFLFNLSFCLNFFIIDKVYNFGRWSELSETPSTFFTRLLNIFTLWFSTYNRLIVFFKSNSSYNFLTPNFIYFNNYLSFLLIKQENKEWYKDSLIKYKKNILQKERF